jgi:hypothetical protein
MSSKNIDILQKNNVILRPAARYGFWEACWIWGLPAHFQASFILINLQHSEAIGAEADMKNGGIY